MRKISFLLIGLMFGLMSFAQEHVNYVPLTYQDGVKWVYYMVTQDHDTIPYTIEFNGDTLVNNHNIPQMSSHDLNVRKCYMTFSKPLVNPNTNEIIFNTEPMLVGWGTDHFNHHTYMHYTREYRSKVRRYCLPLDIVDDEFDDDCFHDMGWIGQNLESTNQYWNMMPDLYSDGYYQFDNAEEVEVDNQMRTLFSSTEVPSPYSQYVTNLKPLQVFMMTGIGWFGNYYGGPNSDQQRCNFSNFLSPFGQLRGNYPSSFSGSHIDDLYNTFESFFSHQEKDGRIIFKSIWYMGDASAYVGVGKVNVDEAFGASDNRWYNLMGQSFDSEPMQPGIYIHQGKKVVVK